MKIPLDTDYGTDPLGDGMFRMVPSGHIVDRAARDAWQKKRADNRVRNDCLGLSWDQIESRQGGKLKRNI